MINNAIAGAQPNFVRGDLLKATKDAMGNYDVVELDMTKTDAANKIYVDTDAAADITVNNGIVVFDVAGQTIAPFKAAADTVWLVKNGNTIETYVGIPANGTTFDATALFINGDDFIYVIGTVSKGAFTSNDGWNAQSTIVYVDDTCANAWLGTNVFGNQLFYTDTYSYNNAIDIYTGAYVNNLYTANGMARLEKGHFYKVEAGYVVAEVNAADYVDAGILVSADKEGKLTADADKYNFKLYADIDPDDITTANEYQLTAADTLVNKTALATLYGMKNTTDVINVDALIATNRDAGSGDKLILANIYAAVNDADNKTGALVWYAKGAAESNAPVFFAKDATAITVKAIPEEEEEVVPDTYYICFEGEVVVEEAEFDADGNLVDVVTFEYNEDTVANEKWTVINKEGFKTVEFEKYGFNPSTATDIYAVKNITKADFRKVADKTYELSLDLVEVAVAPEAPVEIPVVFNAYYAPAVEVEGNVVGNTAIASTTYTWNGESAIDITIADGYEGTMFIFYKKTEQDCSCFAEAIETIKALAKTNKNIDVEAVIAQYCNHVGVITNRNGEYLNDKHFMLDITDRLATADGAYEFYIFTIVEKEFTVTFNDAAPVAAKVTPAYATYLISGGDYETELNGGVWQRITGKTITGTVGVDANDSVDVVFEVTPLDKLAAKYDGKLMTRNERSQYTVKVTAEKNEIVIDIVEVIAPTIKVTKDDTLTAKKVGFTLFEKATGNKIEKYWDSATKTYILPVVEKSTVAGTEYILQVAETVNNVEVKVDTVLNPGNNTGAANGSSEKYGASVYVLKMTADGSLEVTIAAK